jgi:hypothetical protein
VTDRDQFAAAALTGLLSNIPRYQLEPLTRQAWEIADAMLRESGRCQARREFPAPSDAGRDSPGDGWRWVEPGKPVMEGDEYLSSVSNVWCPSYWRDAAPYRTYRRRIKSHANHDAAPAARAPTDASPLRPDQGVTVGMGTGDTQAPVAWAVMLADGERIYDVYAIAEEAKAIDEAVTGNHGVVPLYRSPTLTDEEREAIETAMNAYGENNDDPECEAIEAALWGLLERTT